MRRVVDVVNSAGGQRLCEIIGRRVVCLGGGARAGVFGRTLINTLPHDPIAYLWMVARKHGVVHRVVEHGDFISLAFANVELDERRRRRRRWTRRWRRRRRGRRPRRADAALLRVFQRTIWTFSARSLGLGYGVLHQVRSIGADSVDKRRLAEFKTVASSAML